MDTLSQPIEYLLSGISSTSAIITRFIRSVRVAHAAFLTIQFFQFKVNSIQVNSIQFKVYSIQAGQPVKLN